MKWLWLAWTKNINFSNPWTWAIYPIFCTFNFLDRWLTDFRVEIFHLLGEIVLLFSSSVVSSSLQPHGLQRVRLPCPSPSPTVCSNSYPQSQWHYLIISFSTALFSFSLQFSSASRSFPMSQVFTSGGLELQLQHQSSQWISTPKGLISFRIDSHRFSQNPKKNINHHGLDRAKTRN